MTASVCLSSKISFMECMAASAPDWRPVAIWNGPAGSWISFFITNSIHFPIILRITSPTPIGRTPGSLLRGISRHATRTSTEYRSTISDASNLANQAICPLSSLFSFFWIYDYLEYIDIVRSPIVKVPRHLFVKLAAFKTIASSILSK